MSILFSRSTRSLSLDTFRPAVIGLILTILTLLGLIFWFFFARVTLFQSSASAVLKPDDQVVASFPEDVFTQIKPGQPALLRLGLSGAQRPLVIPALVFDTQAGRDQVILLPTDFSGLPSPRSEELKVRVDVQTEKIAPVELLLRASGKFLNRGDGTNSPEPIPNSSQP